MEENSKSNNLVDAVIEHYNRKYNVELKNRILVNEELSFLNEEWITANLTKEKTEEHKKILKYSDMLIDELKKADIVIFGCPMYNFGISSTLKLYIDLICRSGLTFEYTENGLSGLLKNKKSVICTTSGAINSGNPVDFVYNYMNQVCNFIGIDDCTLIDGNEILNKSKEAWLSHVNNQIQKL